jgi:hypothetical protein
VKTDLGIYLASQLDPPAVGQMYCDPKFGTVIQRVTDASRIVDNAAGDGRKIYGAQVEYSTICPFNCNSTRLLLLHASYFAV